MRQGIPHSHIPLSSDIQAVAVKISLHKCITVCSLYFPPSQDIDRDALDNLFAQLPSPTLLLGDFNAHNDLWGCRDTNANGNTMEDFIGRHGLCLFNDKSPTYLHPATGYFSAIDLSLCSPTIFMDFQWEVGCDQCGSDHFPIFITSLVPQVEDKNPHWKLHKADWSKLTNQTENNSFQSYL